ncbi:MAG: hypothetical protein RR475_12135 [Clostridia bacterium]
MSYKSQETNMRRLSELLSHELSYVFGENESGPNGAKKTFLHVGKTFLRALGKDLGLRDVKVHSNAGGIAVSGECWLYGLWDNGGICVCISQPVCGRENVILYRAIRDLRDFKGSYNRYFQLHDLKTLSYETLLSRFTTLKKEGISYERAA